MNPTRRDWIGRIGAAALAGTAHAQPARRPNVILIMSDDQGYGDLSCHGNPHIRTPNLDRLSTQGATFTRFYVSPVCAPTRASLLTGRYNVRCGVHGVTGGRETMATDETTVAEALKGAGYDTALYGKWHLGEVYPYVPHAQGFDEYIGFRTGHWNNYFDAVLERNGQPYPTKGYIADALTDHAIAYINRERSSPFFLYIAYNTPHTPSQVPDRYWKKFAEQGMERRLAATYGMVENLDENVGRLLTHVDKQRLARDTILIFLTDNGPDSDRYTSGLRGRKGSVYEGGVRVPFFLRWPGRVRPGLTVDAIAAHIDVYPTVLDLCGVARPKARPLDGLSLRPLLETGAPNWPERAIFTHSERPRNETAMYPGAIRTQRYNLVNGTELYDLQADPGEQRNVASEHPEKAAQLRARYEDWFQTVIAERGFRRYPIHVGHAEENPVYLPATQAYFGGDLKYHGGAGYAHDWLTNWSRTEDSVYWEIDVAEPGTYSIALEYLCPATDIGAGVEIITAGKRLRGKVSQPTAMEPLPDRNLVPSPYYLTMAWGRLPMGSLVLPKGRTRLEVKALNKPGRVVMDLKAAVIEREILRSPG
jgi:arylsulfatase A